MAKNLEYKGAAIVIDPVPFSNGWAVSITVDGVGIVDKDDANALFPDLETALAEGERLARNAIDTRY